MANRVGAARATKPALLARLRALEPTWPVAPAERRWITERQAALLLLKSDTLGPPIPNRVVTELEGITVTESEQLPKGLLGASQARPDGGDILVSASLPPLEQRVTIFHELKHVIDGLSAAHARRASHRNQCERSCEHFARAVLVPAAALHADWQAGHRRIPALARRYQVSESLMAARLHELGLGAKAIGARRAFCRAVTRLGRTKSERRSAR